MNHSVQYLLQVVTALAHFCAAADCSSAWVTAAMVSSGFSSMIQCPASLMITIVGLEETSFTCAPSALPFAFSPPIDATGIGSLVLPSSAKSPAVFRKD